MRWLRTASPLLLAARILAAGTISGPPVDVSADSTQLLNTEDKLLFTVSPWSYHVNAANLGLPPDPSHVTFQFISAPADEPGDFTAWLQSSDGSVVDAFPGTFIWLPGGYQSAGYTGPVSVLFGSMDLSPQLAAELFDGGSAVLVLEDEGSPVEVGLPPYKLGQDLTVSLSGNGLGVSAPVTDVKYQDPPAAGVPEPDYRWMVLVFGILLWLAPRAVNRTGRRRIE